MENNISKLYVNKQFDQIVKNYSISNNTEINRLIAMSLWQLNNKIEALDILKKVAQSSQEKIDWFNCTLLSLDLEKDKNAKVYLNKIGDIELSETVKSYPTFDYSLKYISNKLKY
ncbi:hypothetical protein FDE98_14255 [Clostridium sporogenes]|uniref:Tetratricopeptide repeat protein n=1 Tax=Clostridium sporogenes TaxID=1509 RepID=A0A7X5SZV9_CLOSG|nr:hypothetical protein [Clostridium sporogenes]AJD29205.1 hypothetical protein T258_4121 [Clostridium botulinum Prevot_594]NFL98062.1 hypothetical protein [Clostridium botulinum]NFP55293.1 hypothetical protein [Clostridium botulinum]NFQ17299.1 hypothetical protein [Clostridium sporogenes]NFQ20864.1 hypothetical protein [Clostridium sporogenes]